jgi:hypothetical protein
VRKRRFIFAGRGNKSGAGVSAALRVRRTLPPKVKDVDVSMIGVSQLQQVAPETDRSQTHPGAGDRREGSEDQEVWSQRNWRLPFIIFVAS